MHISPLFYYKRTFFLRGRRNILPAVRTSTNRMVPSRPGIVPARTPRSQVPPERFPLAKSTGSPLFTLISEPRTRRGARIGKYSTIHRRPKWSANLTSLRLVRASDNDAKLGTQCSSLTDIIRECICSIGQKKKSCITFEYIIVK